MAKERLKIIPSVYLIQCLTPDVKQIIFNLIWMKNFKKLEK